MKIAGALIALASVATIVAFVIAVAGSKDDIPGDVRACVTRGGAEIVRGPANLGPARREIQAKEVRRVRTVRREGSTVMVLEGQRFRLLVLANASSPPLTGDLPKRLYERADEYPVVALEVDPLKGILFGCSSLLAD